MRSNAGRSTTGEAKVPYYRGSDKIEAAKHLRLTVTRYLAERANFSEVEEAMDLLRDVVETSQEPNAKICTACKRTGRAGFVCRSCGAKCCEHRCGNKGAPQRAVPHESSATCTSCLIKGA